MEIACPSCAETERLSGETRDDVIWITCATCGTAWARDPDVCADCGARSIADRREPLYQKARGTQQSIIGYRIVKECWSCGWAEEPSDSSD
jgi:ribosomal protein L37E